MTWRDDAACSGLDPELFFPVGDGPATRAQETRALAVCAGCPVRRACLTWAVETGQEHGVWGGTTETQRRTLQRNRAAV